MSKKYNIFDWEKIALDELKGIKTDRLIKETPEGIKVKPLYTKDDLEDLNHMNSLPGIEPFVRGPKATMYTSRPWTVRQYSGFSTAKESNKFYKKNIAAGQKGLSIAFDLATHRGYDSDNERVRADVGKAGVAIDTVEDMKILFDGIPLDKMSVSMTMNGAVLPVLASFIVAGEEQGVPVEQLSGTIQNDILKEFMVRNTYIYPPEPSMRIVSDIISYTSEKMPKFNSISISGYHMQEAGANLVQELAFTISDGLEYIRAAVDRGLNVDKFAPRLSFFFAIGMNFFMEASKLRAARYLWSYWVKKLFNNQNPKSQILRTHCQTSGASLQEQDPYNNIVRTTIEALAGVLGGTQSLHTNSFDEAIALPTEFSAKIARNTQLILQNETGVTDVVDPLAGSYYVENLTNELIQNANKIIEKINDMGGMTKAIESGFPKSEIEKSATEKQARIDSKKEIIVGVNEFKSDHLDEVNILDIDNIQVRKEQIEKLDKIKSERDNNLVNQSLEKITNAAKNKNENLLSLFVEAMRNRSTVGETSLALEKVYTRYETKQSIVTEVYANTFNDQNELKKIKISLDKFKQIDNETITIYMAKLGQDGHDRGAKVIASSFADLGFEVELSKLFISPTELLKIANDLEPDVIGISSHAAGHLTLVKEFMELQKNNKKKFLVICGGVIPKKDYNKLKNMGVSQIFGPGTNITDASYNILNLIKYGQKSNL